MSQSVGLARLWWLKGSQKGNVWPTADSACAIFSASIDSKATTLNLHDRTQRAALVEYTEAMMGTYGKSLSNERKCRIFDDFVALIEHKKGSTISLVRTNDKVPNTKNQNGPLYINSAYPVVIVRDVSLISQVERIE